MHQQATQLTCSEIEQEHIFDRETSLFSLIAKFAMNSIGKYVFAPCL
jgi:hypothetical protein